MTASQTREDRWVVSAVGWVHSTRGEAIDDDWGAVEAAISLVAPFGADSLAGLSEFSHVEVVYLFDRVDLAEVCTGTRRPRGNPAWPEVGIFAQRAKHRPNRLGVSRSELLAVDAATATLRVRGLDAIDGTPVLDIKPYMAEFGPLGEVRQPRWSQELMAGYY